MKMSSVGDIPEKVQKLLSSEEKVIGRFSNVWREYYATEKRLIGFERPDWVLFLLILGLLPGVLTILLTRKVYLGTLEYSKITEVNRVLFKQVGLTIIGIIIGVPMIIGGIVIIASTGDSGSGLILIILGIFAVITCWFYRPSFYQLKIEGLSNAQGGKWFISKAKGLHSKNSADRFAELIMTKIRK